VRYHFPSIVYFGFLFFFCRPSAKKIAIADMTTAYNLYQKKDLLEWWNYNLCEEFDAIANTWLLTLDAYIAQLAIEHELQSSS
jgi:predicted nucleic acid-binding protein